VDEMGLESSAVRLAWQQICASAAAPLPVLKVKRDQVRETRMDAAWIYLVEEDDWLVMRAQVGLSSDYVRGWMPKRTDHTATLWRVTTGPKR
jgi:hypothetical protein